MNRLGCFRLWPRALAVSLLMTSPALGQTYGDEADDAPTPTAARFVVSDFIDDSEGEVMPVEFLQPPGVQPPSAQPSAAPAPSRPGAYSSRQRLASVPNMFGDIGMMSGNAVVRVDDGQFPSIVEFDIPGAGGSRRVKIGENNSPLPQDRFYLMYNHFHNVYEFSRTTLFPASTITRQEPIDRYTIGLEKTFFDGQWSVEIRMPLNGTLDIETDAFSVNNGRYGNLAVILKHLCYQGDSVAIGAGLALDTPTGSDVHSRVGDVNLEFQNESMHLLPYVGALWQPTENLFFTGFLQMDIAANGNEIIADRQFADPLSLGRYNEQNLLYVDGAMGYWLYRDPYTDGITGVAAIFELHYTTAVQDTDVASLGPPATSPLVISNPLNRFDVLNASVGLNFNLGYASNLRVAGVAPLGDRQDQRFFDAEVQVQFNYRY